MTPVWIHRKNRIERIIPGNWAETRMVSSFRWRRIYSSKGACKSGENPPATIETKRASLANTTSTQQIVVEGVLINLWGVYWKAWRWLKRVDKKLASAATSLRRMHRVKGAYPIPMCVNMAITLAKWCPWRGRTQASSKKTAMSLYAFRKRSWVSIFYETVNAYCFCTAMMTHITDGEQIDTFNSCNGW